MAKFAKILAALGIGSDKEAVTEAHLQAADDKIAQMEQAKADAEGKLATAEANLKTAQEGKAKADTDLEAEKGKVATLEEWKKNQQAIDGRDEDESNKLDDEKPGAKASWEIEASAAVDTVKRRLGVK